MAGSKHVYCTCSLEENTMTVTCIKQCMEHSIRQDIDIAIISDPARAIGSGPTIS